MYSRIAWIVYLRPMFFPGSGDNQQVNRTVDDNRLAAFPPGDNRENNNKNNDFGSEW
jgi:hypothetical protein